MKTLFLLFFFGIFLHEAASRIHSLKYFYTGSSQVPNFPEFVAVGLVDDVQMYYYDSDTEKAELKQEWMKKVTAENPQYLEEQTAMSLGTQQTYKANIDILKPRFNQTDGVHIFQYMYGCEWDEETKEVKGFRQDGYDGEDFISFDLKTETWTTAKQQAVLTKMKWEHDQGQTEHIKQYLNHECPDWVKKYIHYGHSSLMRTDGPTVSFLQKSPSAPVSCHATGFYPSRASMHWKKDGVEISDNVHIGEILPNNDGTFQMSIDLSSVKLDQNTKYECVFQLSGVDEDIVHELKTEKIMSNEETNSMKTIIIIIIAVVLLCATIIAGVGFVIYNQIQLCSKDKRPPSPVSDSEVTLIPNPKV